MKSHQSPLRLAVIVACPISIIPPMMMGHSIPPIIRCSFFIGRCARRCSSHSMNVRPPYMHTCTSLSMLGILLTSVCGGLKNDRKSITAITKIETGYRFINAIIKKCFSL